MTRERLEALHALVGAAKDWADTPMLEQYTTRMERRLRRALAAVQACGADVAVLREREGARDDALHLLDSGPMPSEQERIGAICQACHEAIEAQLGKEVTRDDR